MAKRPAITVHVSADFKCRFDDWMELHATDAARVIRPFLESLIEGEELDSETRITFRRIADTLGCSFQEAAALAARIARARSLLGEDPSSPPEAP